MNPERMDRRLRVIQARLYGMTRLELEGVVLSVVSALYGEDLDPDRSWSPDDIEAVGRLLSELRLTPVKEV